MEVYEFISKIAWPIVALIGILILGPGGVLKSSIIGLADKLMSIRSSIEEFKKISDDFSEKQRSMAESMQWLKDSGNELARISNSIDSVRENMNEFVLAQGEKQISDIAGEQEGINDDEEEVLEALSPQQRFDAIYSNWGELTEIIRQRIGKDNYDGRAIGSMARKLSHKKRVKPISKEDAELVETLHSQFKRFGRLQATKEDWLSDELYRNFIRGIEKAKQALA